MPKDQDKPAKVRLNLDTLEREGKVEEPYAFVLGGRQYVLLDPQDEDFRVLLGAQKAYDGGNLVEAMEFVLQDKDREAFFANKLTPYMLNRLFLAFSEYYGLPSAGEAGALSPS